MPFGKLQVCWYVPFTEEWILSGHFTVKVDWWSAAEMVVLLEVSPISTEELHQVLGHHPTNALLPRLLNLVGGPALEEYWSSGDNSLVFALT